MSGGGVIRGPAGSNDCRIYVGNLPPDIRTKDVEDVFYKYGIIRDVDLKNRTGGGPPFAFVEFEDPRWAAEPSCQPYVALFQSRAVLSRLNSEKSGVPLKTSEQQS